MQEVVDKVTEFLSTHNIQYDPTTYYYSPLTGYPRSITPKTINPTLITDLSEHQTLVYIHTPNCTERCTFCPFYLDIGTVVSQEYVDAMEKQILRLGESISKKPSQLTLYFGGGSPNLLSPSQIEQIITATRTIGTIQEINTELHPEVAKDSTYLEKLKKQGVSRVSFGLQTTSKRVLKETARHHGLQIIPELVIRAKNLGFKTNIDMMYGFREEHIDDVKTEFIELFAKLMPDWVTTYQLCLQEETVEFDRYTQDKTAYPSTAQTLRSRALIHEIAKLTGYQYLGGDYFSRANTTPTYQEAKWGAKNAVIGIGAGTYSYVINGDTNKGILQWTPFDKQQYLGLINAGQLPIEREIQYTPQDVIALKTISGLKKRTLHTTIVDETMSKNINILIENGFIQQHKLHIELTRQGILIEDLIYASLMPRPMWEQFREERDKLEYTGAKYDWFFEPQTVLKFKDAIGLE